MSGQIAHVGPNLPMDLLRATGRHAGPLPFDPDRATPVADQWMETKFAPWARAILEGWAAGDYDGLDRVLFSRADDSAQRLYYYLCELQRRDLVGGPDPLIVDIAKVPRASSIAHSADCVRQLAERLAVSEADLVAAVDAGNAERRSFVPPAPADRKCALAGTPPPDHRLHHAADGTSFIIHGDTLAQTWTRLGAIVGAGDVYLALAQQLHEDPAGPRSFANPGTVLTGAVTDAGAQAVVLWQTEEDEAQAWHLPAQRRALEEAGIPALVMTRRDWLARDGAAAEITAFLQGLGR